MKGHLVSGSRGRDLCSELRMTLLRLIAFLLCWSSPSPLPHKMGKRKTERPLSNPAANLNPCDVAVSFLPSSILVLRPHVVARVTKRLISLPIVSHKVRSIKRLPTILLAPISTRSSQERRGETHQTAKALLMPHLPKRLRIIPSNPLPASPALGFPQPHIARLAIRMTLMNHERRRERPFPPPRKRLWIDKRVAARGAEEVEGVVRSRTGGDQSFVRDGEVVVLCDRGFALVALLRIQLYHSISSRLLRKASKGKKSAPPRNEPYKTPRRPSHQTGHAQAGLHTPPSCTENNQDATPSPSP